MSGGVPLKHHYVPRLYLKNFSYDEKRVFVQRKGASKPVSASIRDICAERDFYSRFGANKYRDVKIENAYSKLESGLLKEIIRLFPKTLTYPYQSGGIILDPSQKIKLSDVIMLQITRGKSTRSYGFSIAESLYGELLKESRKKFKNAKNVKKQYRILRDNKEAIIKNALVEGAILPFTNNHEHSELRDNLLRRNCVIFINHTSLDFITSDDPVLVGDGMGNIDKIFNYPLGNADSQVYYPLSPKHLAILFTPESCEKYYCNKGISGIFSKKDMTFVKKLNAAQYKQCINCAISYGQKALNDARSMSER